MTHSVIGTLIRCADIDARRIAFYRGIGLTALQLAGVYEPWLAPDAEAEKRSDELFALFRDHGLSVPSLFLSYPNQNWSDPVNGIGLVPETTRAERMALSCRQMNWAARRGIRFISCHVGFLPEAEAPRYDQLIADLRQLALFAGANNQEFLFETGTDRVTDLARTFEDIDLPNVGINFDPANLLIYNRDDPAKLIDRLGSKIRIVHCKDAARPTEGAPNGRETVLGKGETNFASLLRRLIDGGFSGPLIIERELQFGPEQEKDVSEAVGFLQSIIKENQSC